MSLNLSQTDLIRAISATFSTSNDAWSAEDEGRAWKRGRKECPSITPPEAGRVGMDCCGRPLVTLCLPRDSVLAILQLLSLV